jgi:alpha-glucosidase (family GH31 glycosyl hydrolase)
MTRILGAGLVLGALMAAGPAVAGAQDWAPGRVVGAIERSGSQVRVRTEHAVVRLEFCTPATVRVRARSAGAFRDDEHIMVARHTWPVVDLRVRDEGEQVDLSTSRLTVRIHKTPFRIEFIDIAMGRTVAADEAAPGGGIGGEAGMLRSRMRLSPSEQFFGFGERMDRFNWRGHSVVLNVGRGQNPNHDLGAYRIDAANYCPVPFFMSTDGYGIFFHTARETTWDMGERSPTTYQFSAAEDELDYYFFLGPGFRTILAAYTDLTGRTPLLPKPGYGVNFGTYSGGTWGHEADATQDYVVQLVQRFRDERIPIDALHLDSTWREFGKVGGRNATSFEWRKPGFPDAAAMFAALRDRHVALAGLHVRPRLDNGDTTSLLDEARAAGAIADTPTRNIVNFFDPAAAQWWWQHAVVPKVRQGAGFLKTDEGSVYPGESLHNLFPVVYAKAAYEGFQKELGRRGFNLTREGYAGVQRYPYIWAGDWPSRWTFFAPMVRGGLSIALSGIGAWGHNAGGFEEVATEELYLRWTPFGFFNPVAHFLGMEHPQYKEPWRYGEKALATFRRYAQLRQRLLPYIYSAAYETYASGIPMMRPLVLDYPADRRVWDIDDQFFFGDALLVAPITQAGATGRRVFLPPGDWLDYWTGEHYAGDRVIDYAAPPEVLPLFVRAGAIIPMQPEMNYVGERAVDPLTLDVYPSGRSSYVLYEDDGVSLDYQKQVFAQTRVTSDAGFERLLIQVQAPQGSFRVAFRAYEIRVHLDRAPRGVRIDSAVVGKIDPPSGPVPPSAAAWWFDPAAHVLTIVTDPARKTLAVRVDVDVRRFAPN